MTRYKNISGQDQNLVGFGLVKADSIITTDKEINNPNFEKTEEGKRIKGEDK